MGPGVESMPPQGEENYYPHDSWFFHGPHPGESSGLNINFMDGSRVIRQSYSPGLGGAEVVFYRVEGGGHTMPSLKHLTPWWIERALVGRQNHDLESAHEAWSFFRRQRLVF